MNTRAHGDVRSHAAASDEQSRDIRRMQRRGVAFEIVQHGFTERLAPPFYGTDERRQPRRRADDIDFVLAVVRPPRRYRIARQLARSDQVARIAARYLFEGQTHVVIESPHDALDYLAPKATIDRTALRCDEAKVEPVVRIADRI